MIMCGFCKWSPIEKQCFSRSFSLTRPETVPFPPRSSAGLQHLGGRSLESKAKILVDENLIVWESQSDVCSFLRNSSTDLPAAAAASSSASAALAGPEATTTPAEDSCVECSSNSSCNSFYASIPPPLPPPPPPASASSSAASSKAPGPGQACCKLSTGCCCVNPYLLTQSLNKVQQLQRNSCGTETTQSHKSQEREEEFCLGYTQCLV